MTIALFSDIHANLPALEACFASIGGHKPVAVTWPGAMYGPTKWSTSSAAAASRPSPATTNAPRCGRVRMEVVRFAYDVERAASAVEASLLPAAYGHRLLRPVSCSMPRSGSKLPLGTLRLFSINARIMEPYQIPPQTRIGHVHLKVSDLERSLAFYRDLLGFELMQRYGSGAAFLSAGGYHHHIGLNTWHSKGAPHADGRAVGLYHTAILYPERADLARILRRLLDVRYPLSGASDHGVSEALYLDDPDGNGVELYWDRPRSEWPFDADGSLRMLTLPLDLKNLLGEL